ncbi:VOC family protein [Haloarchaeobius amylolyticus]|uniref:VOC family protein n=1 Tax=Haloarchaeobius amylolyticus TaxID=1198296 RepID=UPI00226DFA09|nr:VOC family protein [Haloarchaeobius amylolyticus]
MDPRITVVTLGVDDLDAAIEFYRDGLGLPLRDREPDSDIAFFTLTGTWLALYPWDALAEDATVSPDGDGFSGVTLAHNVPDREAVDALLAEAVAAGAELVKEPQETFWGGYSGYFADLDGHLWEVAAPRLDGM